ncbi:MAG: tRNA-Thr(GGU) m(6)t(6)A37 methyltransferase TsaA [Desulfobacterales bacterium C00003060]|nr:MAG: tRNA-Thr(GGU) m(6)t(6)A37 methyltransferase TsaA [Desulfobacterales bacterium C00003060]
MDSFRVFPVGKVRKDSGITTIEIYDKYADALSGLNNFSHLIVLYWFHKNDTLGKRKTLRVHPRHNMSNPLTGVFATRSPRRPNLIGLSICKILSIENNVIRIDTIDAFHDTPVLDLKPYIPPMDSVQNPFGPKWAKEPPPSHSKGQSHP